MTLLCVPWLAAQDPGAEQELRIGRIEIETRNVFSEEETKDNFLFRLANDLHSTTRPEFIQRELWFGSGDPVHRAQLEELERNLRGMGIFGEVETELQDAGGGASDLRIRTRDRFSLILNSSISLVGGVQKFGGSFGEGNLFGTGKQVIVDFDLESGGERTGSASYVDPQFLGGWHRLSLSLGETEEGPFGRLSFRRPLKHLADDVSYGITVSGRERDVDYFRAGQSTVRVSEERFQGRGFISRSFGPAELRSSIGLELRLRHSDHGPAIGVDAARIRVPGQVREGQLGPMLRLDYLPSYRKVMGLDALDFVEDLGLGLSASLRPAYVLREESGTEGQGFIEGRLRSASEPLPATFLTTDLQGMLRWRGRRARGWRISAALHAFNLSLPGQTLAGSLTYDAALERQDLVPQLTLGEDNGLRGYPARELSGSRRIRLNLEDRVRSDLELLSLHLGFVAFFDAGWLHDATQGLSLSEGFRAVGVGLRLGSSELFGRGIIRVDLAWPLDELGGNDFRVSLSIAAGQVFEFFGNTSELRAEL